MSARWSALTLSCRRTPGVMGGVAVFSGTRVPIEIVIASLDRGIDKQRTVASYPFLTDEHIQAARVYTKAHL